MVKKKQKEIQEKTEENKTASSNGINYWMVSSIILGILLVFSIILILFIFILSDNFGGISKKEAEEKLKEFASLQGAELEIKEVKSIGSLYKVSFSFMGQEGEYYVSKDGKYIGQMIELEEIKKILSERITPMSETPKEIPKSNKPKLELFVMTHCPYGTQAEKGFIPFMEAIGNKVDSKIRFVHYFMHGQKEENETYRQVCIREEQPGKFIEYLKEFLKEGDSAKAGKVANIDEEKVKKCIDNGNAKKYYVEDSELSKKYGVQGSPTLVVNEVQASSGRSPAAYLQTACSAFNTKPSECSTLSLSSQTPAPMWGWDSSSASATTAQC